MRDNALRRRDPRLPSWSIFQDVQAAVDGVPIRSVPTLSEVDRLIIDTSQSRLEQLRSVGGRDLDDWLVDADDALRAGEWAIAIAILRPIVLASLRLTQYDSREPDWHRVAMLADAYQGSGDHRREEAAIRAWLAHWPEGRESTNKNRDRALRRLTAISRLGSGH